MTLSIYYLIFNIFGQGFQNVLSDDTGIILIGSLIVFISKYEAKPINYNRIIFLLMLLIVLNKNSMIYLVIVFIFFNIVKNFLNKDSNAKFLLYSLLMLFLWNFLHSFQTLHHNHYLQKTEIKTLAIMNAPQLSERIGNFNILKASLLAMKSGIKIRNSIIIRNMVRIKFIKEFPEIRISAINIIKKIFTIEVYKASIFPTYRYIQKQFKTPLPYLPKIGLNILFWYPILTLILFLIERKTPKNTKSSNFNRYFYTLFFISICGVSILANIENNFQAMEQFKFEDNALLSYSLGCNNYENCLISRDYGRYLGWPISIILFIILYKILHLKISIKKIKNYLTIILIFMMSVSPARSFAYLYGYSDSTISRMNKMVLERQYLIPSQLLFGCEKESIGFMSTKHFADERLFRYMNIPFLIHFIEYDQTINVDYNKIANLLDCLIVTNETVFEKNDWTLNNFQKLFENNFMTFYKKVN